ncbi:Sugar phosphate permease [Streptoalloteichus tenebrarius]|uniref:Sugar phosphate permease n=1 Tax=Streptoalloteichus tenebrarius (strain ATCC 17920 / DSM 40477 / JCM 4838 / CBS 697.72 / NBRC 16177 / NCIMB 11028 / NRRL B-12390 / A12253. 1 / ISP 5477) TaxID=1933 RepID=A0ABT1HN28_STRSD|nr:MFS transporter [Streptoalloteichus tenebrarius]MCP2256904.1 Sugar phosphate permease [Streptoalloteichus tenebrarius]BFF00188.1 MFS transporter [Streptoalloteichus tenebrarius]
MPVERATRRAWLIWSTAVAIYFIAMFHRTSLGVAGLQAGERFGVGAAGLGTFTVLQVGVYAAMQVPTGLLVDRFGPRRVLTAAALLLGVGQTLFAVASSYPLGLAARAVLGVGDALTWVSVLRLVAAHFPARRYAVVVSLSGVLGAAGNLAATVPLTLMLDSVGWTVSFLAAGLLTAAYSVRAVTNLRDVPEGTPVPAPEPIYPREVAARVLASWRTPGTRLGFWVHFSTTVVPSTLGLLWGFPYLVRAQGLSQEAAGGVLSLLVVGGLVGSPLVGGFTARRPELRMFVATGFLSATGAAWALLLTWPGHLPVPVLGAVFVLLSMGGPVSAIGFALARDYNPFRRVGTATGVVNVGGFVATTVAALSVGVLLDLVAPLGQETAFRVALLAVAAVLAFGTWRTAVWWRRARAVVFAAEARGEEVPVRLRPSRWDVLPAAQPALAAA